MTYKEDSGIQMKNGIAAISPEALMVTLTERGIHPLLPGTALINKASPHLLQGESGRFFLLFHQHQRAFFYLTSLGVSQFAHRTKVS